MSGIRSVGDAPRGRVLRLEILSNWGDNNYFGLAGLAVLTLGGEVVPIEAAQLTSDPADLNQLDGGAEDPRTVDKLLHPEVRALPPPAGVEAFTRHLAVTPSR